MYYEFKKIPIFLCFSICELLLFLGKIVETFSVIFFLPDVIPSIFSSSFLLTFFLNANDFVFTGMLMHNSLCFSSNQREFIIWPTQYGQWVRLSL